MILKQTRGMARTLLFEGRAPPVQKRHMEWDSQSSSLRYPKSRRYPKRIGGCSRASLFGCACGGNRGKQALNFREALLQFGNLSVFLFQLLIEALDRRERDAIGVHGGDVFVIGTDLECG